MKSKQLSSCRRLNVNSKSCYAILLDLTFANTFVCCMHCCPKYLEGDPESTLTRPPTCSRDVSSTAQVAGLFEFFLSAFSTRLVTLLPVSSVGNCHLTPAPAMGASPGAPVRHAVTPAAERRCCGCQSPRELSSVAAGSCHHARRLSPARRPGQLEAGAMQRTARRRQRRTEAVKPLITCR